MNNYKVSMIFFLVFLLLGNVQAAGNPVDEDFSMLISLCDDMVELAKQRNTQGFLETVDVALKLSEAQRRDNSMAIDRLRPKLRSAKKAVKSGDFDAGIGFVAEAKSAMKVATPGWDGG
jgi:hypothetical protein